MGKTTNILDLNNRLERVEKENVAQNNYNSLKNRPKINGNLLTGDKTGTQLGLANVQDIGNLSDLNTTDKSSAVGAINELNTIATTSITKLSVSGLTLTWNNDMPDAHKAIRVGNIVVVNVGLDIDGTFTGTTGWSYVYDLPNALLRSGESFISPFFTSMMCVNRRNSTVYDELIQGRQVYLDASVDEYHLRICGQMILVIVKS